MKLNENPSGKPIMIRLPDDLRERIDEKAKENRISRNDVVRMIVADFFRKGGTLVL